jgi:hypothetical protein
MRPPGGAVRLIDRRDRRACRFRPVAGTSGDRSLHRAGSPRHYADEFAESHAKAMVVRNAHGRGDPCGRCRLRLLDREAAGRARSRERHREVRAASPFAAGMPDRGLRAGHCPGRAKGHRWQPFPARCATRVGELVGDVEPTSRIGSMTAVRQKTRWIHGIAFQSLGPDWAGIGGPLERVDGAARPARPAHRSWCWPPPTCCW